MTTTCNLGTVNNRKFFWATQPSKGSSIDSCGSLCHKPGLELSIDGANATIKNEGWLRGLIINMLGTDGRKPETECGYTPGARGGHWTQSYMEGTETEVGTLLRTVDRAASTRQLAALVGAHARATLARLVARGLATNVEVEAGYGGAGRVTLDITVYGKGNQRSRVGLVGTQLKNGWAWDQ
jgi:phage gp46-like protein